MKVLDKAKELGEAIVESTEFQNLKKAEAKQDADPKAMELLKEYSEMRTGLAKELQEKEPTAERMEEIRTELNQKYDELMKNEAIGEYMLAKTNFQSMIDQMNSILSYYVTGEQPSACSGDCHSCGGSCSH